MDKAYLKSNRNHFKYFPLKQQIKDLLLTKNFKSPTLVQGQALSILLEEGLVDVCVIIYSFNGSGKTLSFLIPVLNSINYQIPYETFKNNQNKKKDFQFVQPQAIIIVPTQALLDQTYSYLKEYTQLLEQLFGWKIKIGRIFKGNAEPGHIIVGLTKKANQYYSKCTHNLTQLKWVVFDECDEIKASEPENFNLLLKKLSQLSTANFILCSATGNDQGEGNSNQMTKVSFRRSIQQNLPNRNIVQLDILKILADVSLTGVVHYYMSDLQKDNFIIELLYQYSNKAVKNQIIIFFNSKAELRNFYETLKKGQSKFSVNSPVSVNNNIRVGYVHGDCGNPEYSQNSEDGLLGKSERVGKLRNKDYDIMLATDIIARGIDIRTVTLVINYSEPWTKSKGINETTYIHRVGRTGRYKDTGVAVTFVKDNQLVGAVVNKHKVAFKEVKSISQILSESEQCLQKNEIQY